MSTGFGLDERDKQIIRALRKSERPIITFKIAEEVGVTRQTALKRLELLERGDYVEHVLYERRQAWTVLRPKRRLEKEIAEELRNLNRQSFWPAKNSLEGWKAKALAKGLGFKLNEAT